MTPTLLLVKREGFNYSLHSQIDILDTGSSDLGFSTLTLTLTSLIPAGAASRGGSQGLEDYYLLPLFIRF